MYCAREAWPTVTRATGARTENGQNTPKAGTKRKRTSSSLWWRKQAAQREHERFKDGKRLRLALSDMVSATARTTVQRPRNSSESHLGASEATATLTKRFTLGEGQARSRRSLAHQCTTGQRAKENGIENVYAGRVRSREGMVNQRWTLVGQSYRRVAHFLSDSHSETPVARHLLTVLRSKNIRCGLAERPLAGRHAPSKRTWWSKAELIGVTG
ncbi:hypothetical protein K438DRAFT_1757150 [Mycena galopus ATCC 62051]|nr:hypothetical protein K438DRAFT_1757150 [Mycena galopus ATCC 62051]